MSIGRPSKYKQEYCELLIEHMEKGFSYESFAGQIGVSKQTIYDWEKANEEFLDAKEVAFEKSRLFWEKQGIVGLYKVNETEEDEDGNQIHKSKQLNATVWVFNMKNRFGWRDKQPDEDSININITLAEKMAKARARAGKKD